MKHPYGLLLWSVLMLSFVSCAAVNPEMKRFVEQDMPEYVQNLVAQGKYRFEGHAFQLDKGTLGGWIIEEVQMEGGGFDTYEKKYKGKRQKLLDLDTSKLDYDAYADISTFNMAVSCGGWLHQIGKLSEVPREIKPLSIVDEYCHRLINPERKLAYNVILFIHKEGNFINDTANSQELLAKELENLKRFDSRAYDSFIFRDAEYVEPSLERLTHVEGFLLLQFVARRYSSRFGFLHAGFGKRRDRDTYILILTGKRIKLILQTFYPPRTNTGEIEKDLKIILESIDIR